MKYANTKLTEIADLRKKANSLLTQAVQTKEKETYTSVMKEYCLTVFDLRQATRQLEALLTSEINLCKELGHVTNLEINEHFLNSKKFT